jgi:hypothetical protein
VGDSASTFDMVVLRPDGTKVWNRLYRKDQLLILKWSVLTPDQEVRFADVGTSETTAATRSVRERTMCTGCSKPKGMRRPLRRLSRC